MDTADISVVIDVYEMEEDIAAFIRAVSGMLHGSGQKVEYIIVDKGSHDATVLEALQIIDELHLCGKVIQNGDVGDGCALNTGLYRSSGTYVIFVRPSAFYHADLPELYDTAQKNGADIVYSLPTEEEKKAASRLHLYFRDGSEILLAFLSKKQELPLGGVLLRREFLFKNRILFDDDCTYGYEEEFLYRSMLATDSIYQAQTSCWKDRLYANHPARLKIEFSCFQKVDAMLRVLDDVKAYHKENKKLRELLEQEKIPATVLECVEMMLKSGRGYNAISRFTSSKGYIKYLKIGHLTSNGLKKKIFLWRNLPWMYKV